MQRPMTKLERDLINGVRKFANDLRDGKPIPVTTVRRYETPDGPMHTFEKGYLTTEAEDQK